jgi:hypothetical protein
MEKIFCSKDGLYLIIIFSNQSTVIILNNILKKIQLKINMGPGIRDAGFIYENGETFMDKEDFDQEEKNKIVYFVTLDKVLQLKIVSLRD